MHVLVVIVAYVLVVVLLANLLGVCGFMLSSLSGYIYSFVKIASAPCFLRSYLGTWNKLVRIVKKP